MAIDKKYFIHSRGGLINRDGLTTAADVDGIVGAIGATSTPRRLTLHFHGGLVSQAAGFQIAESLLPVYTDDGGSIIFFVWESGAWETIRNNLTELADEPVFKQLLRKVLEHALKRVGVTNGARSIAPGQVDPLEVKETLETFIANPSVDTIPYKKFTPIAGGAQMRSAADSIDEDEIQADLEGDTEFTQALATLPDIPAERRSAVLPPAPERRTPFSLAASEKFSDKPGQRGFISLFKAAVFIKDVLIGILRRYDARRDHGFYATCVEEIVRGMKVGGSGVNEWGKALQWNRIKQDCRDAFGADPDKHAGTALLVRLRDAISKGSILDRVNLVGHSTGAVYICEFLEAADRILPQDVKFDIVLLAPAVTYTRFASTLRNFPHRIANFRMFSMSDELEREDQVWGDDTQLKSGADWRRFIYPSSLLYLVSGLLESREEDGTLVDEPDMPLLGMQRFFAATGTYEAPAFSEVVEVREWLQQNPNRTVWAHTEHAANGLVSLCNDHGAFDNEPETIASLKYIIKSGF